MIGEIAMISINLDKGNKHNLLESSHKYSSPKNNFYLILSICLTFNIEKLSSWILIAKLSLPILFTNKLLLLNIIRIIKRIFIKLLQNF